MAAAATPTFTVRGDRKTRKQELASEKNVERPHLANLFGRRTRTLNMGKSQLKQGGYSRMAKATQFNRTPTKYIRYVYPLPIESVLQSMLVQNVIN